MADSKLSLKNIHHVYEQKTQAGTEAIRQIDLEVRDGELLAIVGAVSYTHLDVYKRQIQTLRRHISAEG